MKKYRINIPAFEKEIEAEDEAEAIEIFNDMYEEEYLGYGYGEPTVELAVKVVKN